MTYAEEKRIKEEKRKRIASLTDTEKLKYIVGLLNQEVDMFADYSDMDGVDFTHEYLKQEEEIEEFLEIMKQSE